VWQPSIRETKCVIPRNYLEEIMHTKHLGKTLMIGSLAAALACPLFALSTNSTTFEGWANDTAVKNNGRISRDAYMNEMGRRWDAMPNHQGTRDAYLSGLRSKWDAADRDNRGLTPAEVSRITGNVDSTTSAMPKTGTGVQPGNMGPANSKGQ